MRTVHVVTGRGNTQAQMVPPLSLPAPDCLTRPPQRLPPELLASGFVPDISSHLCSGAYATVRRIQHATTGQEYYALKIVEKIPLAVRDMMPQLEQEIRIQSKMTHENILNLIRTFEDTFYVYMILDFCGGGTLRSFCLGQPQNRLAEPKAATFFHQILKGVEHIHSQSCAHRDLKGDNILLTRDGEVRICDFGSSAECL